jgi:hypothetical protein
MEIKILKAVQEKLENQPRREKMIGDLKDNLPLGECPGMLAPLLFARQIQAVLPLDFGKQRYFELARCKFRIVCQDNKRQEIPLRCKGLGGGGDFRQAGAPGVFPGIQVEHTHWADEIFNLVVHGPKLAQLTVKRYYLAEFELNRDPFRGDSILPKPAEALDGGT